MPLLLTHDEIVPLLDVETAVRVVERAHRSYAEGSVLNVPWSVTNVPLAREGATYRTIELRGVVPELGVGAVRFISTVVANVGGAEKTVPLPYGKRFDQIFVFDMHTGELLGILAGEHVQSMRVGATSAIGAQHLARTVCDTLGIIGSGPQAEKQIEALALVRPPQRVLVYSRTAGNREAFARKMSQRHPFPVDPVESPQALVEQSDLFTSATSSKVPTFDGAWVRPGTHVNVLGPQEVDNTILERASLFTLTKGTVVEHLPGGRSHPFHAQAPFFEHWEEVQDLEPVMLDSMQGRRSDDEITLFYGTGAGLQFAALGHEVLRRARERGVGRDLPADWFVST